MPCIVELTCVVSHTDYTVIFTRATLTVCSRQSQLDDIRASLRRRDRPMIGSCVSFGTVPEGSDKSSYRNNHGMIKKRVNRLPGLPVSES